MLSMWYTRKELALRMSLFYCGSISSNGWGSLIAAGILSRFHDWRLLFYIEGGITMAIGMAAIWILPGMPATARWLSEEDRQLQHLRMQESAGQDVQGDVSVWQGAKDPMMDPKTWVMSLVLGRC
ncbi:hypothetical protein JCM24511_05322 [Saitozyma sp. JCM 24511]|nr:hypothetical protein JCM24511_05322 [Saitozyma sp. JCM 24511]